MITPSISTDTGHINVSRGTLIEIQINRSRDTKQTSRDEMEQLFDTK